MKEAVAETFRFIGAVGVVLGVIFFFVAIGIAVAPYVCLAIVWVVANYGLAAFAAAVAVAGFGLFHIGQIISPWRGRASSQISSKERA